MKDFIFRNGDNSFYARLQTSVTRWQDDNENTFTVMSIGGLNDFEVAEAKMIYQRKTATIKELEDIAKNGNLKLEEVVEDTKNTIIDISTPLAFTTSTPLTSGTVSSSYSDTINAQGGSAARSYGDNPGDYTFSVDSGSLPDGLSLNEDTGEISGTPTSSGTYTFIILLEDEYQESITKQFEITIS